VNQQARSQTLLRYRFTSRAQAARHFHVRRAWGLVFWPQPDSQAKVGATVMIELLFDDSEQTRVVAGEVAGITGTGLWIRSAELALGRELEGLLPARHHRRLGANLFLELRRGGHRILVTLRDLSLGGAQIGGVQGVAAGEMLQARLMSAMTGVPTELGTVSITWLAPGRAGLRFDRSDPRARLAVGKLYSALEEAWKSAPVLLHNPMCCREACLDPSPDAMELLAG
jgi:hypothetical protein